MAQGAIVRERLLAGINPFKAAEFTDEESKELVRKYVDEPSI
jgi:hypothetical protein